jgi:DNA repair protein RecO (recombination protein O)
LTSKYTKLKRLTEDVKNNPYLFVLLEKGAIMFEKTRGIVLHQVKYTDSGIIVQLYTRRFGRQSVIIKGVRNKKSGRHVAFFQPMFILDLVMYHRESRDLQVLKEFSAWYVPADISAEVRKSCVAIFLGEVLSSVLREESPQEEMYDYIEKSIIYFDQCRTGYANFHIAFLSRLSSFLGFEPVREIGMENMYFDMINGTFVPFPPDHKNFADKQISGILSGFFNLSLDRMDQISLTGSLRNEVLETLVKYYSLHLPGLKKINSIEVLKEIFR